MHLCYMPLLLLLFYVENELHFAARDTQRNYNEIIDSRRVQTVALQNNTINE